MLPDQRLVLVAALARNRVIGAGGGIPWHLPGEQRRFKELTLGHTLLLGRSTHESIGRPLPGRRTVVLTRDPQWAAPGVEVAHDLDEALEVAGPGDVMIGGGAQLYEQTLPRAHRLELTHVHLDPQGDTFFPEVDDAWATTWREEHDGFTYATYRRGDAWSTRKDGAS